MPKEDLPVSFRISKAQKKALMAAAAAQDKSASKLIEEALELRLAVPDDFWGLISNVAEVLKLPVAIVIVHKLVKQMAWEVAWIDIFGRPSPSTNAEFQYDEKGLISGDRLLNLMRDGFRAILREAKEKLHSKEKGPVHYSTGAMESLLRGLRI
jgi:hypothetical protein